MATCGCADMLYQCATSIIVDIKVQLMTSRDNYYFQMFWGALID